MANHNELAASDSNSAPIEAKADSSSANRDWNLADPQNSRSLTLDRQTNNSQVAALLPSLTLHDSSSPSQVGDAQTATERPGANPDNRQSLLPADTTGQIVSDTPTSGIFTAEQVNRGEALLALQVTAPVTTPVEAAPAANNIVPFHRAINPPVAAPAGAPPIWQRALVVTGEVAATTALFVGAIFVGETELQRRNADQFYEQNGYRPGELPPALRQERSQLSNEIQAAPTSQTYGPTDAELQAEINRRSANDSRKLDNTLQVVTDTDTSIERRTRNLNSSLERLGNESNWTQQIINSGFIVTPETSNLLENIGRRHDRLNEQLQQIGRTEEQMRVDRENFNRTAGQTPGQRLDEVNDVLYSTRTYDRRLNDTAYETQYLADLTRRTRELIKADEVVRQRGNISNHSDELNQENSDLGQALESRATTIEQVNQRLGQVQVPPELQAEFNRRVEEATRQDQLLNEQLQRQQRDNQQLQEALRSNQNNINGNFSLSDDTAKMVRDLQSLDRVLQSNISGARQAEGLAQGSNQAYQQVLELLNNLDRQRTEPQLPESRPTGDDPTRRRTIGDPPREFPIDPDRANQRTGDPPTSFPDVDITRRGGTGDGEHNQRVIPEHEVAPPTPTEIPAPVIEEVPEHTANPNNIELPHRTNVPEVTNPQTVPEINTNPNPQPGASPLEITASEVRQGPFGGWYRVNDDGSHTDLTADEAHEEQLQETLSDERTSIERGPFGGYYRVNPDGSHSELTAQEAQEQTERMERIRRGESEEIGRGGEGIVTSNPDGTVTKRGPHYDPNEANMLEAMRREGINVPTVRNSDFDSVTMDRVEGQTLREFLETASPREIDRMNRNLNRQLDRMERAGLYHGDLEGSDNIIINPRTLEPTFIDPSQGGRDRTGRRAREERRELQDMIDHYRTNSDSGSHSSSQRQRDSSGSSSESSGTESTYEPPPEGRPVERQGRHEVVYDRQGRIIWRDGQNIDRSEW